ncbi:MAG TPA: MgtC/SapB family protein, partial [Terriglobia bacterium]|nr:MgtC/SapB family protein [Terriglobia bacterium]
MVSQNEFIGILIAALGGLAVGLEREWSGHARGPNARFAGVRTFTLLGILAGISGWLWVNHFEILSAVLLSGAAALVVAAYVAASRREVEGTTEVASLVVLAAGLAAGIGSWALAGGAIAVTTLLLVEKSRIHDTARKLDDTSVRAAVRFGVMAVVILPLLPEGPFGPGAGFRPRTLWTAVLIFSGLSFAGYLARKSLSGKTGYPV